MIEIPALESERGGCPHPEAETAEIKWIYLTESIIENESLGYKLVSKIRALMTSLA